MFFLLKYILFFYLSLRIVEGVCFDYSYYNVEAVSPPGGLLLESPQWSQEEQVLYYVDNYAQIIYRYDPRINELTSRQVDYGFVPLVIPIKDQPGLLAAAVRNAFYILRWGAPRRDSAFKLLTVVDLGKPDNNIDDGKVDANGNLWFGTFGKAINIFPDTDVESDEGTVYMINKDNFINPEVKIRPVTISNGIAWSPDTKKMYFNDSPTRVVQAFDYDLEKRALSNGSILFKFDDYDEIPKNAVPDGMTVDIDGNIWVATFQGASILKIDPNTGELIELIRLPVDIVSSVMWGDDDLSTLYVTTGSVDVEFPKPLSGSLFAIRDLGTQGIPENSFDFPDAVTYV